jgi:PAS domain S-box-containing protein
MGIITNCWGRLYENFGRRPDDVLGKNVGAIIPGYIRKHHDEFLRRHVEFGVINLLFKNRLVYGMHKDGHIIPVKAYISPSIHLDDEFTYIGMIRPLQVYDQCLIPDDAGQILSYTYEIG